MTKKYFLGANSKNGFYSLYKNFPGDKARLHIIKSGPGTGKSTFMRNIGKAAEAEGLDVEYLLCSGDPASLDGIYIPELESAWVDGTAPHITEPGCFQVDSDYVNLGAFFKQSFTEREESYVNRTLHDYRLLYSQAYAALRSAAEFREAYMPKLFSDSENSTIIKRVDGILNRYVGKSRKNGNAKYRFLSAICCEGIFRLPDEITTLCKHIYAFDDKLNHASFALGYAAEAAIERGAEVIACPSPLEPEKLEALIFPAQELALISSRWDISGAWNVRIDSLPDTSLYRKELREGRKTEDKLMAWAFSKLKSAKELHDGLEAVYQKHMDFEALNEFTQEEIKKLLA